MILNRYCSYEDIMQVHRACAWVVSHMKHPSEMSTHTDKHTPIIWHSKNDTSTDHSCTNFILRNSCRLVQVYRDNITSFSKSVNHCAFEMIVKFFPSHTYFAILCGMKIVEWASFSVNFDSSIRTMKSDLRWQKCETSLTDPNGGLIKCQC